VNIKDTSVGEIVANIWYLTQSNNTKVITLRYVKYMDGIQVINRPRNAR